MKVSYKSEVTEAGFAEMIIRIRDAIRRRWLMMAIVSAIVFAAGTAFILMMTPQYSATARIRIDPSRSPINNDAATEVATLSPEAIETEVSILKSADLSLAVVKMLKLDQIPEFTKGLASVPGAPMSTEDRQTAITDNVLRHLDVSRDKLTFILGVRYTSANPILSAKIANAFASQYMNAKVGSKVGTAERQSEWFKRRLDALGTQIREADARVAQYRAQAGITQGAATSGLGSGTIVDQQIAPLSTQLAMAQSDAAAAQSQLRAAEAQVAKSGPDSVSEVLNSPVIGNLRSQRAQVLQNMGAVEARYGAKHPESLRVREQLAGIDLQLRDESNRIIASLRSTATAAAARAGSLQGHMNQLASEQATNTRSSVLADSLDREAAAKREMYNRLSQMSLQSTQASTNQIAQAEIIEQAKPPLVPTSPNKPLLLALVLVVALGAGAGTIAVQEMMVTGLRTSEDLETKLGIPMLAAVPAVPKSRKPADLLLERPTSIFAESLRIARASILGVRAAKPPQIIAITSALPSEGKTTTALAFARTLASNNARTLLVECDVRRAVMHESVQTFIDAPGIVEVLHREATIDQAIQPGDVPNLDQMLVKAPYFSSGNLFGDGYMEEVLASLRSRYDSIVLDLPPILGLADGRFLAALSDVTALIIRWDATPTPAAISALSQLQADGANVVGAIFTLVDSGAEAVEGLYYSKKYSGYYQSA